MGRKVNTLGILIKISILGVFIFYEYKMYEEYKRSKKNLEYGQKIINKEVRDSFLLRKENFYLDKDYQQNFDKLKKTVPENEISEEFQGGIVFE
ncbi:hypothetical protein [Fusobacterium varium]|uniref:hypothetical protein n=1 Tax=Fusobacterium varium TaxID=856 RepID=UPI000BBAE23A|nr:hypothetical protein [uncultured Fusobacterium sp.]BBA51067.1 hypothetical protein FV113G1_14160 [Fusobacterium varium]